MVSAPTTTRTPVPADRRGHTGTPTLPPAHGADHARTLADRLGVGLAAGLTAPSTVVRGPDPDRVLPVREELAPLFPSGSLRRGSVVRVPRSGALVSALLSAVSGSGAWCALVGGDDLGLLAAAEFGVDLDRLALVPDPGDDWPAVTAALLDALDIVVLRAPTAAGQRDRRRLTARLRERGAVLLVDGPWPGADLELRVRRTTATGIGLGHGRLTGYTLLLESRGRGAAARPRRADLHWGTSAFSPRPVASPLHHDSTRAGELVRTDAA